MKNKITALALIIMSYSFTFAQKERIKEYQPLVFDKESGRVKSLNNFKRKFNEFSVSFGAGIPLLQSGDLVSNNKDIGNSFYVSLDKALTHAFGLVLQYDRGETKQSSLGKKFISAKTQFDIISLLGDVNFSNLLRRIDNRSFYRWAFHGYFGVGFIAYKASRQDGLNSGYILQNQVKPFTTGALSFQAGAEVKHKISRRIDLGFRTMYVLTNTDSFDGGGNPYSPINLYEEQNSDNFFNFSLGLTYKIGTNPSHLMWHDPMQEIYYKLDNIPTISLEVCKKGDKDHDGVCDDWDKQLDTPKGARVDGAGVALDTDLDGVIDLFDKCVTIPGVPENDGCPLEKDKSNSVEVESDYDN